jgi:hypothetical protein
MCISQRSKNRLNDNAVAISPNSSAISIDGSGGYGLGIGSVESDGE